LIRSGAILVPILIQPKAGAIGLIAGSCFFVMQRFHVPGCEIIAKKINQCFEFNPYIYKWYQLMHYPVIYDTNAPDDNYFTKALNEKFIHGNLLNKLNVINSWVNAIFIAQLPFAFTPQLGSLCQGIAISRQIVVLF
jgi:hypothetical protein